MGKVALELQDLFQIQRKASLGTASSGEPEEKCFKKDSLQRFVMFEDDVDLVLCPLYSLWYEVNRYNAKHILLSAHNYYRILIIRN